MDDLQITNISSELNKLHKAQKDKNEIRASLFTLIIYTYEERRRQFLQDIVQNIIEKYPCRIIFIAADRNPDASFLRVSVDSALNSKGTALIACDQINIEVGQKQIYRVPYLILPHLLTDLPIYLLWGQDPTIDSEILPKLEKLANRFIFDAECTKNLHQFTEVILKKHENFTMDLVDINWALASNWRDILMHAFVLPEHLEELRKATTLSIVYNNEISPWIHQPEIQAIYLQAWLATRLKWTFKSLESSPSERLFIYSTPSTGKEVLVKLIPQPNDNLSSGSIISLSAESQNGYHFLIKRDDRHLKVSVNCSSQTKCELPITLPLTDSKRGFTFMNEIFYTTQSEHYIDVLKLLNLMEWK